MPLTAKQQRFVEEYLVDMDATKAATRAGYSARTATQQGYQMLQKPAIQAAVKEGRAALSERTQVTQDWIVERLVEQVERAMQAKPVVDAKGNKTGEYVYHGAVANKALELLGKHIGMWSGDDDPGRKQPDFVPLEDRLRAMQREDDIEAAANVERLRPRPNGPG